MKLGVFTVLLGDMEYPEAFKYLASKGVQAIELGCGGYPGNAHCKPKELLADNAKFEALMSEIKKYDFTVSALSCHRNPVHPDKTVAAAFEEDFENAYYRY